MSPPIDGATAGHAAPELSDRSPSVASDTPFGPPETPRSEVDPLTDTVVRDGLVSDVDASEKHHGLKQKYAGIDAKEDRGDEEKKGTHELAEGTGKKDDGVSKQTIAAGPEEQNDAAPTTTGSGKQGSDDVEVAGSSNEERRKDSDKVATHVGKGAVATGVPPEGARNAVHGADSGGNGDNNGNGGNVAGGGTTTITTGAGTAGQSAEEPELGRPKSPGIAADRSSPMSGASAANRAPTAYGVTDEPTGSDRPAGYEVNSPPAGYEVNSPPGSGMPEPDREPGPEIARPANLALAYVRHRDRYVADLVSRLSLQKKVGQLLMPALSYGPDGKPATHVHERVEATIRNLQPGGVIFFGGNLDTVDQTKSLIEELSTLSSLPLFFAIDEEGGTVSRLHASNRMGATEIPPARKIGRLEDPNVARQIGEVIGRELRALGFNLNLAPVADVRTDEENSVISERAFGSDPHLVGDMVSAVISGLHSQNVGSVIKHFPGHGATKQDSHQGPVTIDRSLERLREVELVPFRAGIQAGAAGVMAGHISAPGVTGNNLPASLSPELLQGVLRDILQFDGLIVSDSLSMQAVTGRFGQAELAVRAVQAGNDILLDPQNARVARNAVVHAVRSGRVSEERIDRSVARILRTKLDLRIMSLPEDLRVRSPVEEPGPPAEVLGHAAHQRLIEEVRARAQ